VGTTKSEVESRESRVVSESRNGEDRAARRGCTSDF